MQVDLLQVDLLQVALLQVALRQVAVRQVVVRDCCRLADSFGLVDLVGPDRMAPRPPFAH